MVVLIWLLQHSCTNIKIENDFLVEISKSNFCRVKNLLKKKKQICLIMCAQLKATFLFYLRTSIFLYTHHIINVIYFILWKKSSVHLITFLTYFFTETNKYWLELIL